jgi:hypothetical protein
VVARLRGVGLRRVAASLAIAAGAALGVNVACGPGDLGDLTAGRRDAGGDTGVVVAASICNHASAPERPKTPDGPNIPGLVFAFDAMRFDTDEQDGGLPKPQGLDLDRTCTCDDPKLEGESCIPPDSGEKRACDGVDGRDNAAGPLLSAASAAAKGVGPAAFQKKIRAGVFNVLVTLDGWNGLPDDPNVVVGVQLSNGLEGSQNEAGAPFPARFDGTDVWTVAPVSVLGGVDLIGTDCRLKPATCVPLKVDTTAYVRDSTLVAHLDIALPLDSANGSFQIEFVGATTTAKIAKEGDHYRATGEVVGRWPLQRILPSLARLPNPLQSGRPLCATDSGLAIYQLVKSQACAAADLAATPAADRTSARCDALSNALTFSSVTATAGTIYQPPNGVPECADFADSCDK